MGIIFQNGFSVGTSNNGVVPTSTPTATPTPTASTASVTSTATPTPTSTATPTPTTTITSTNTNTPTPTATPTSSTAPGVSTTPTPTPTLTPSTGGGIGAWYFYSDEGTLDALPPLSDGNSIFLIRNNQTNEVTETFNPNKSDGVNEIYFNLDDSSGTNYTTQFTALATNGGTISITQGANTVTYTSTTPGTFFADTNNGIFTIQTGPATQTVTSANPFVFGDPISLSFS
jgi:hypothetical protein